MHLLPLTDHHPDIVPMGSLVDPKLAAIDALVDAFLDPSRTPPQEHKRLSIEWREYLSACFAGDSAAALFHASFMVA